MNADTEFCTSFEVEQKEWMSIPHNRAEWRDRGEEFRKSLVETWIYPQAKSSKIHTESIDVRFFRLAEEWSLNTRYKSSVSDMINDSNYQQIIALSWPVVPLLLNDLKQRKRFWFPALAAITGVRPFDPIDTSNYVRMTDAWIRWGKRKGLI
jgi:hypothetical protein